MPIPFLAAGSSIFGAAKAGGSLLGGAAGDAADKAATESNNASQDLKNQKTLNTRNSQQDEADSIADQSMENGINGMKVKMAEAQIRRSNDTVQAAGSIG